MVNAFQFNGNRQPPVPVQRKYAQGSGFIDKSSHEPPVHTLQRIAVFRVHFKAEQKNIFFLPNSRKQIMSFNILEFLDSMRRETFLCKFFIRIEIFFKAHYKFKKGGIKNILKYPKLNLTSLNYSQTINEISANSFSLFAPCLWRTSLRS